MERRLSKIKSAKFNHFQEFFNFRITTILILIQNIKISQIGMKLVWKSLIKFMLILGRRLQRIRVDGVPRRGGKVT